MHDIIKVEFYLKSWEAFVKKPVLKVIRKDAVLLKQIEFSGYQFRLEDIQPDGWYLRTW